MAPLRRVIRPMFRYGEADFDADYLRWGMHDRATQIREAESVLAILQPAAPLRMLDLACGVGTHAIYWAGQGHAVTAVDLSETFVRAARRAAEEEGVRVEFRVADIERLDEQEQFDVITWIEPSFFSEAMACAIYRALRPGGAFMTDVRNPDNPRVRARNGDWRTWREEDGVYYLERHETNPETGRREDAWITIDPVREIIEEKVAVGDAATKSLRAMPILEQVGFGRVQLRTMEGEDFAGGEEPQWLWLVGYKG